MGKESKLKCSLVNFECSLPTYEGLTSLCSAAIVLLAMIFNTQFQALLLKHGASNQ